jgi:hypothetical protein
MHWAEAYYLIPHFDEMSHIRANSTNSNRLFRPSELTPKNRYNLITIVGKVVGLEPTSPGVVPGAFPLSYAIHALVAIGYHHQGVQQ